MISFFQSSCIPFSFWKETVSVLLGEDRTCPCAIISYIDEPYMELDRDLLGDWLVRVGFGRDLHIPFWFGTASQLIRLHATTPWAVHSLLGAHVPLFHLQVRTGEKDLLRRIAHPIIHWEGTHNLDSSIWSWPSDLKLSRCVSVKTFGTFL